MNRYNTKFRIKMEKVRFKAKFFGSKEHKGQIEKQVVEVEAHSESDVENVLRRLGWRKINGLKIRVCSE